MLALELHTAVYMPKLYFLYRAKGDPINNMDMGISMLNCGELKDKSGKFIEMHYTALNPGIYTNIDSGDVFTSLSCIGEFLNVNLSDNDWKELMIKDMQDVENYK